MKKEEIDKLVEKSLNREEAAFYRDLDQQGVFKMWFDLYKGKMGPWAKMVTFFQLLFSLLAFWLGFKFFSIEGVEPIMRYGGGLLIAILFVQMLKLWHWMQMDKNAILREMKRLEYQVAVLMEKHSEK